MNRVTISRDTITREDHSHFVTVNGRLSGHVYLTRHGDWRYEPYSGHHWRGDNYYPHGNIHHLRIIDAPKLRQLRQKIAALPVMEEA